MVSCHVTLPEFAHGPRARRGGGTGAGACVVLRPCPFCGGDAVIDRCGHGTVTTVYTCTGCGCHLETSETDDFGSGWNDCGRHSRAVVTVDHARAQDMPADEWIALARSVRNTLALQWGGVSVYSGDTTYALVFEKPSLGRMAAPSDPEL